MSYHRGNLCWIPYQIGQRYTKSLAYCWWGWFCPFYSNVCTPLLVYSEWFCGDVQPTDQVTHWPVVLVGISGFFCAKTWDAFYLVNQFLKQRAGWGRGGASARVTVLFWNTIAREMGLSHGFLEPQLSPTGIRSWFSSLEFSSLATKFSTHKENAQSSFSVLRVRSSNGLMGSGDHKKYEVQGQLHFTLEFFYLLSARIHSLESPTNMPFH